MRRDFFKLYFVSVILFVFLVSRAKSKPCVTRSSDSDHIFYMKGETEDFIKKCITFGDSLIKWMILDSCVVDDARSIMTTIKKPSMLEKIVIFNSSLKSADLTGLTFSNLKVLNFSRNYIKEIELGYMPTLIHLDLSFNLLNSISITSRNSSSPEEIDLSHNSLEKLNIMAFKIKNLNISNSFLPKMKFWSIDVLNNVNSLDLSNNFLSNVNTLNILKSINILSLKNNSFINLEQFTDMFYENLTLNLMDNPLQCTINLTTDWLIMKRQNIKFEKNLQCKFTNSTNQYDIHKYGLLFSNENDILHQFWSDTRLSTFLQFRSMQFFMEIESEDLVLSWTNPRPPGRTDVLNFKSQNGSDIHWEKITMCEIKGKKVIKLRNMSQVAKVCLLLTVEQLTLRGYIDSYINVYCKIISVNSTKDILSNLYLIILTGIFAFLTIILSFIIALMYCCRRRNAKRKVASNHSKIKKHNQDDNKTNISSIAMKSIPSGASDSVYSNECKRNELSCLSENFKTKFQRNPNCYVTMNNQDEYRISTMDNNIYEEFEM